MNEAKFPISDDDMRALLAKYPFLYRKRYWAVKPDLVFKEEKENLESNHYKEFDGTGWEDLWKNKYLPRLFEWYDQQDEITRENFCFLDIKEKFGEMRIYTSLNTVPERLEQIAEWLSSFTCSVCGKVTHENGKLVIWRTGGWITNYCEECAKKYATEYKDTDRIDDLKVTCTKGFGFNRYNTSNNTMREVVYQEDGNGWLKKVKDEITVRESK